MSHISSGDISASKLLQGLSLLQKEGTLCDVELQVEGKSLLAHRALLAAASPYFSAMLTGGFCESDAKTISLKDTSYIGLKV